MRERETAIPRASGSASRSELESHETAYQDLRRLLARKEEVLTLLQDVAVATNEAASVEHALQFVIDRICAFTGWPVGHAFLPSAEIGGALASSGVFHLDDLDVFAAFRDVSRETIFEPGQGLPGRVLESRAPEWISDVRENVQFPRAKTVEDIGIVSGFAVPILAGDRAAGVLEFYSRTESQPDADLLQVMSNIGAQLGRVIEREQAAEDVRASEERLRALTDSALEAIITADSDGFITDWNPAAERIFGHACQEALGKSVELIMPERFVQRHRQGMNRMKETGESRVVGSTLPVQGRRKDGREIPVELSLSTWTDRRGRSFGAVIRDVSERSEAEAKIRTNQERLREREVQLARAQRVARLGSWEWDVVEDTLTWSDEMCRLYGIEPGCDLTFEQYVDLVHPDDRQKAEAAVREAFKKRQAFSFDHRIVRADTGEVRILHGEGEVQTDEGGRVVKMFGTGRDITEMRQAEVELRESERKFRLLAENMSDLILLQDRAGKLLYVSPSSIRILGHEPHELVGRSVFDLIHPLDADQFRTSTFEEMLEGKTYAGSLVRAYTKEGSLIWLEFASKRVVADNEAAEEILTSGRDVTERIQAEDDAARYRGELEKRNRELQDFAYVASHDLQEPLRKIRAFSDLLEEDYGDRLDEEGIGFLERVQDAASRMSTLISELLAFSRVTTRGGRFSETDLNEVVAGVLSDLEVALKEADVDLEVGPLPTLAADPLQMRQLMQNLIGNAIKFRRADVRPVIRVTGRILQKEITSRTGTHPVCRLEISDNGMGFESKYADRIFTPFQRLHHQYKISGTGMGLAICRRIVERHDGTISAESAPDDGATFVVELPVHQASDDGT